LEGKGEGGGVKGMGRDGEGWEGEEEMEGKEYQCRLQTPTPGAAYHALPEEFPTLPILHAQGQQ